METYDVSNRYAAISHHYRDYYTYSWYITNDYASAAEQIITVLIQYQHQPYVLSPHINHLYRYSPLSAIISIAKIFCHRTIIVTNLFSVRSEWLWMTPCVSNGLMVVAWQEKGMSYSLRQLILAWLKAILANVSFVHILCSTNLFLTLYMLCTYRRIWKVQGLRRTRKWMSIIASLQPLEGMMGVGIC